MRLNKGPGIGSLPIFHAGQRCAFVLKYRRYRQAVTARWLRLHGGGLRPSAALAAERPAHRGGRHFPRQGLRMGWKVKRLISVNGIFVLDRRNSSVSTPNIGLIALADEVVPARDGRWQSGRHRGEENAGIEAVNNDSVGCRHFGCPNNSTGKKG